jgi:hypothetical protein
MPISSPDKEDVGRWERAASRGYVAAVQTSVLRYGGGCFKKEPRSTGASLRPVAAAEGQNL